MPAAAVLEHLDGVFVDVAVRLERRHGRDHDDVAAGALQRLDPPVELALARRVDDVGEVVDRRRSAPAAAAARVAARAGDERTGSDAAAPHADDARHRAPPVDVVPDAFAGVDVAREQRRRDRRSCSCRCRRREHLADERRRHADARVRDRRGERRRRRAPTARRSPSSSRAMLTSSVRNGGGGRRRSAARRAVDRRCVSRKPSRRWIRWLLACSSQPRADRRRRRARRRTDRRRR